MFFDNLKIATRIGLVVGTILILMLVLAVVEIRGINSIKGSLAEIIDRYHQRTQLVQLMRFQARHNAVLVRNILLVSDKGAREQELKRFIEAEREYTQSLNDFSDLEQSPTGKQLIAVVREKGQKTFELWKKAIEAGNSGAQARGVAILLEEVRSHQFGWLEKLNDLAAFEEEESKVSADHALAEYEKTKIAMALINVLAIGAGLFFVITITASIVLPLREMMRKVDAIAGGDLSVRMETTQQDEIGKLGSRINNMVDKLQASEQELEEYRLNLEEIVEWRTGEVNDQRERFISVLIHDLKAPLVPIIGFSRLLMTKNNLREEKIVEYAGAIHDSSTKLSATIERTSQELRERRLAHRYDTEPFDIEELLCWVVRNRQSDLEERNIELQLNRKSIQNYLSSDTILFPGDSLKIRSLMENLLGNAVKYARSRIDVTLVRKGDMIEFIIDDDGNGVEELYHQKIFDEYFQAPGSREGTGVGLYSVKRIVEHYKGSVAIATSPAGGARFIVSLPILPTSADTLN
jgi:signal transduction histidine kinase